MDVTFAYDDPGWDASVERAFRREVRRLELELARRRQADAALRVSSQALPDGRTLLELDLALPDGRQERVGRVVTEVEQALPELVDALVHPDPVEDRAVASVLKVLHEFRRAARREIRLGELESRWGPGAVDPDEVVDVALTRVLPALAVNASPDDAWAELEAALLDHLAGFEGAPPLTGDETTLSEEWTTEPDAEAWVPEDAWVPPERLTVDDRLPDRDSTDVEAIVADREARARLVRSLFRLERRQRTNWEEVAMGGWAVDRLAAAQGRSAQDLASELEETRTFLSNALGVSRARVDELYAVLGRRYRSERRDAG